MPEPKAPSIAFSICTFLIGLALAIGAANCMEHAPKNQKSKCTYPATLEAICPPNNY